VERRVQLRRLGVRARQGHGVAHGAARPVGVSCLAAVRSGAGKVRVPVCVEIGN
jgi:hypothetical protein